MRPSLRDELKGPSFDEIYRRFAIAGLLLFVLPVILLFAGESPGALPTLGELLLLAGGIVAIAAAWRARRAVYDWRVRILVGHTVLMVAVALLGLLYALSAPEGDIPDLLRLGFFSVTVLFPLLAFSFAGWWFLWAWRRRRSNRAA